MSFINNSIVNFVKILPKSIVYIFAKKYIAGVTLQDGLNVVKKLNEQGILATMDVLGESITSKDEAIDSKNECIQVLDEISQNSLDSNLSVKPTQLGLGIDEEFCFEQVTEILDRAKSYNNFVRLDMEDSPFTDKTLNLYERLKERYDNVGIVLQSYLKRTLHDIDKMNPLGTNYRLCKGIYVEPEEIAFKDRQLVRDNFMNSLEKMLDNGNYVGIATHDDYLIDASIKMIKEKNISNDKFEFQMLYGVRENVRDQINKMGYKVRIYVPFGEKWYAYSIRRLQENPQMAWYITKSLFTFGR